MTRKTIFKQKIFIHMIHQQINKISLFLLFVCLNPIWAVISPSLILGMSRTIQQSQTAIGVQTLHYEDSSRSRPVVIELWYPSDHTNTPLDTPEDKMWVHPKEIRNVKISNKKSHYPLILMSHGHKGDRRERSWLSELLVKQGFIVASVEHFGSAWPQYNPLSMVSFWDRALDISFALDHLLEHPVFKKHLDSHRIGFIGYSLGGMTGLALAGAQSQNSQEIALKYSQEIQEIPLETLQQIDYSPANRNYKDSRIKAFLLLCPATFAYPSETFRQINVPIALVASMDDEILPHKEHALRLLENLPIHRMKILNHISHYAFLNLATENGLKILQATSKTCPKKWNWSSVHQKTGKFALHFFEETLN